MIELSSDKLPAFMNPAYLAGVLECEESTIEEECRRGSIPAKKWGRSWIIPAHAFVHVANNVAMIEAAERTAEKPSGGQSGTLISIEGRGRKLPQLPEM